MANSLRFAGCRGRAVLRALATVLSKEGNKTVHRLVARRIDHGAPLAADGDQSGEAQPIKVKSERVGGEAKLLGDLSGGHAFRPRLHKKTKDFQAVFHISTIIEVLYKGQALPRPFSIDISPYFGYSTLRISPS
jgi:hypothetical protein